MERDFRTFAQRRKNMDQKTEKKRKWSRAETLNWKRQLRDRKQTQYESGISLQCKYDIFNVNKAEAFKEYPLSVPTKDGLEDCCFVKPTAIQKAAILPALKGNDILGAAKTGSGKTLAFLIPVLEVLYRHKWNSMDGPGALVISPTRELALQTFEVLCKVGRKHDFSAGLVIGGKDVQEEAERVCRTNIVVCTPGRLLQHLDSTCYFSLNNLKMLILDEADRILDFGFADTLNAILENLPADRQTLLFSATQTNSVKDLARLSLKDPVYISVHAESKHSTPKGLEQHYTVCPLYDKVNLLYSFVKHHLKTKTLVFVSSCKQVQYLYYSFCQLRPGIPVMHLHGNMQMGARLKVYREFNNKKFVLLIATDLAARGLDFPDINWVIQLDCPEDSETYIHRAGRTARLYGTGKSLMVLLPSETAMLDELKKKNVPIEVSNVNASKVVKIDRRLRSLCAKNPELREQAKRAFVAYIKSVHVMKNREIFKLKELPSDEFALSLGLAYPPRIRFIRRMEKRALEQAKQKAIKEALSTIDEVPGSPENGNDLFSMKKVDESTLEEILPAEEVEVETTSDKKSQGKKAKLTTSILRRGATYNERILFDDSGKPFNKEGEDDSLENEEEGIDLEEVKERMKARDVEDKKDQKRKVAQKRLTRKLKEKESAQSTPDECRAELASDGDNSVHDEETMWTNSSTDSSDSSSPSDSDDSESESKKYEGGYSIDDESTDSSESSLSTSGDSDLLSSSEATDSETDEPDPKRVRPSSDDESRSSDKAIVPMTLQEQEDLALRLIGK